MVRPITYFSAAALSALISQSLRLLMPTHEGYALLASQSPGLVGLMVAGTCLPSAERWSVSQASFASLVGVSLATLVNQRNHMAMLSAYFIQSLGLLGFIASAQCTPRGWKKWALIWVSMAAFFCPNFEPVSFKKDFHFGDGSQNGWISSMWEPMAFRSCLGVTVYTICVFLLLLITSMGRHWPKVMYRLRRIRDKRFRHPVRLLVDDFSVVAPGDCSICLDKLENDEGHGVLRLSCQHCFHMHCISDWQDKSCECPVCRQATPDIRDCTHLIRQTDAAPGRLAMETRQLHVLGDDAPIVPPPQPGLSTEQDLEEPLCSICSTEPQWNAPLIRIPLDLRPPQPEARLPPGISEGSLYATLNNV